MSRTLYEAFKDEIVKEREEGRGQGILQGREAGAIDILVNAVKKGFMTISNAASMLNISVEQFKGLMEM